MAKRKSNQDDKPIRMFCNVISDGSKSKETECNTIMDNDPNPIKGLKSVFGAKRVQAETKNFSHVFFPKKRKKSKKK